MKMTNKEVFDNLIGKLFSDSLVLKKDQCILFDFIKRHYFQKRNTFDLPINDLCKNYIDKIYGIICSENFDSKTEITKKFTSDYLNNNIILSSESFEVLKTCDDIVCTLTKRISENVFSSFHITDFKLSDMHAIAKEILVSLSFSNEIDLGEVLTNILDKALSVELTETGIKLQTDYESRTNPELISNFSPESVQYIGQEDTVIKIKEKLNKEHFAAIEGEKGAGKYTLASACAKTYHKNYDIINCIKWNHNFKESISDIPSSDDRFYCCEKTDNPELYFETPKDRISRKLSALKNSTQTRLLIIYDIDKDIKREEVLLYATENLHIILCFKIRTRLGSITPTLPFSKHEHWEWLFNAYCKSFRADMHKTDIDRLKNISCGNIYVMVLLLKYAHIKGLSGFKLLHDKLYLNLNDSLFTVDDDDKIDMEYHGEKITGTLFEHLTYLSGLNECSDEEKSMLCRFAFAASDRLDKDISEKLLDINPKFYADMDKRFMLKHDKNNKCVEISPLKKLVIMANNVLAEDEWIQMQYRNINNPLTNQLGFKNATDLFANYLLNISRLNPQKYDSQHCLYLYTEFYEAVCYAYCKTIIAPIGLLLSTITNENLLVVLASIYELAVQLLCHITQKLNSTLIQYNNENNSDKEAVYLLAFIVSSYGELYFGNPQNLSLYNEWLEKLELAISNGDIKPQKQLMLYYRIYSAIRTGKLNDFIQLRKELNNMVLNSGNYRLFYDIVAALSMNNVKPDFRNKLYYSFESAYNSILADKSYNLEKFIFITAMNILKVMVKKEFDCKEFTEYSSNINNFEKYSYYPLLISTLIHTDFDCKTIYALIDEMRRNIGIFSTDYEIIVNYFYEKKGTALNIDKTLQLYEKMLNLFEKINPAFYSENKIKFDRIVKILNSQLPSDTEGLDTLLTGVYEDDYAETIKKSGAEKAPD